MAQGSNPLIPPKRNLYQITQLSGPSKVLDGQVAMLAEGSGWQDTNPHLLGIYPSALSQLSYPLLWWRIINMLRPIENKNGQEAGGCTRTVSFTGRDAAITPRS